jgi:hypothetical protein
MPRQIEKFKEKVFNEILECLNEVLKLDPIAINKLRCKYVVVNKKIAKHPCYIVGKGNKMSFLGLFNGIMTEVFGQKIARQVSDTNPKKIINFVKYNPLK